LIFVFLFLPERRCDFIYSFLALTCMCSV